MKYRKLPVVIDAMEFTEETKDQVFQFVTCNRFASRHSLTEEPILVIQTLEGDMEVHLGDFVIKGIKGESYPCKPDIFRKTYEAVS